MIEGQIPPKWRNSEEITKKEEDDRISTLPDCLLLEILSHLPSTKSAIRTGTLSKRWERLWTLVPTLIFERNDDKQSWTDFVSLVDKTLAQCRQSKLKKFEVRHPRYHDQHVSRPNDWIRYALRCNVEELKLTIGNEDFDLQVDQSIFTASCLTNLSLLSSSLNPTGAITWKNLKSLCLMCTELDEKLIKNILSGSPVLETLVLEECIGFNRLDIDSKSLKNLVFTPYIDPNDVYDDSEYEITIYAPHITSLTIKGELFLWKVLLVDVSSLVEAKLDYYTNDDGTIPDEEEEEMLKGLIPKLQHVKELTIVASCSNVLSRLEAKGFDIPSNLKFVDYESD